ncbi:MAG: thermonuclease family protein [Porticoccaceae bacterium]
MTAKKEPVPLRERIVAAVIFLAIPSLFTVWTFTGGDPRGQWVLVTHVTDGDTIGIGRGWRYEKVRLIGVDTPETVHPEKPVETFGPEASDYTGRALEGRKVHLKFEPRNEYDRYGRLLAYVFLMDGTLFNAELVKQGYARVIAPAPFRYYKKFKHYEQEARKAGLGIWGGK